MTEEEKHVVGKVKVIEALHEVALKNGSFATVIKMGTDTDLCLTNCKVESVLKVFAARAGCSLKVLRCNRSLATGNPRQHMDYYEISPSLVLMPVPYGSPFNSNHGVMAYANIARVVRGEDSSRGKAAIRFLSGSVLPVQLGLKRLRDKIDLGRRLMYANFFAREAELERLRLTIRQIQEKERELL